MIPKMDTDCLGRRNPFLTFCITANDLRTKVRSVMSTIGPLLRERRTYVMLGRRRNHRYGNMLNVTICWSGRDLVKRRFVVEWLNKTITTITMRRSDPGGRTIGKR